MDLYPNTKINLFDRVDSVVSISLHEKGGGSDRVIEHEGTSFKTDDWQFNLPLRYAKAFLKKIPGN